MYVAKQTNTVKMYVGTGLQWEEKIIVMGTYTTCLYTVLPHIAY